MLRKISFTLICAVALLSTNTYSMMTYPIQSGVNVEYNLPPNDPLTLINFMYWEIEAKCKIVGPNQSDEFLIETLAKSGKINGVVVAKGESLRLMVYPDEHLFLSAESGAKIKITNLGQNPVKAACVA